MLPYWMTVFWKGCGRYTRNMNILGLVHGSRSRRYWRNMRTYRQGRKTGLKAGGCKKTAVCYNGIMERKRYGTKWMIQKNSGIPHLQQP